MGRRISKKKADHVLAHERDFDRFDEKDATQRQRAHDRWKAQVTRELQGKRSSR